MTDLSQITQHMEVVGSDGIHVGLVDRVEGGEVKLMRRGTGEDATGAPLASGDDRNHRLDADAIARVEGNKVYLKEDAAAAARREADI